MIYPLIHLHSERDVQWREIKSANTYTGDAHTYIHTQTRAHIHAHTCAHKHTHTHTHTHTNTHSQKRTLTHTNTRVRTHIYTNLHTCTIRAQVRIHMKIVSTFDVIYLSRTPISSHICSLGQPVRFKAVRWSSAGHPANVSNYLIGFDLSI